MPVTRQWLPVEDGFEKQLLERLVADGRSFVKGLRYHLSRARGLANATLTDCDGPAKTLFIVPADSDPRLDGLDTDMKSNAQWVWRRSIDPMPVLPQRSHRRESDGSSATASGG